ncbi:uncharacterized protein LOC5579527 isoform X3 [Aedes aegypti]|nr:uncharacterized protein LOC5579527 isoform X3 [Aedes aegypti]XP_021710199.1 uncharacterized protein LOC5579527 isoform X3 [Aedes aegypti]XP_021710200.1 uncharacterized protein LOC5579527 isoform X3 [Aedes aegypti]XP_021710201.1 uncharacterized protein LOC5579527 isoform X3 [Aedes aegypti]XP_021710202.1 uncharacterized protein LOC5579527 isoform X3 [Aedes aegypti]XP_021710203.1 uncharacterized protein LOC5579527 isoform X3 [Aedes aegypti]XP_021710204.1 uncharacterized protein LOC5579527 iso
MTTINSKMSTNVVSFMLTILAITVVTFEVTAQSNYASHANSIEYQGEGLPEEATLDGKVTKLDDLSPIIFLNRTKAALNCAAGSMQVDLKFNEKFFGTAYANFDRNSACQITGKGDTSYSIELPLKGCGTKQEPQRVFTNNIVVRFHPGLEMDGDEIITIVCRYPPPVAPVPAGLPAPILTNIVPASILEPPLKGIQILFIICAIMFLTLLLIGLGVSYYCLRRQPMPIVRRVVHVGSGSEITALETGSIGSISGMKIAPVHTALHQTRSISGSDGPLIPSDYPSESHSENEEVDTGSLPVSSHGSYENSAFVQDSSSIYSENYGQSQDIRTFETCEASPKFDIHVRVKRTPPPLPSPLTSDTESNTTISRMERNNLSTILESHEDARSDSVLTFESLQEAGHTQFTYTPELHTVPKHIQQAPVVSKITKAQQQYIQRDTWPENYVDGPQASSSRSIVSLGTEMTDTHSMTEIVDSSHLYPANYHNAIDLKYTNNLHELPVTPIKKNAISSHVIDDVFMQTVTEKTTIEDIEKHKRMVTEYKAKPVIDPNWDVTIRNYQENSQPEWEDFSDVSSASGMTIPQTMPTKMTVPTSTYISESDVMLQSPELVGNMKPIELPPEDKSVSNWDVLIRVLQDVEIPDISVTTARLQSDRAPVPLATQLSYEDKAKWKQIITTESTLRTMLTEAVVREDFERIRTDARYENLFEPQSWEIIMRILAPPDDVELRRSSRKKRETWDTRSRRSSLPTLYEYDSDGGSSVRTITQDPIVVTTQHRDSYESSRPRSRKTSRSSYSSNNVDYRSMTEMTVDFAKSKYPDSYSDGSSYSAHQYYEDDPYDHRSIQRSSSHPSLARSASEFTERWVAPEETDSSTPDASPQMTRRERNLMVQSNVAQMGDSRHIIHESQTQYIETRKTNYRTNRDDEW